ncbi:MAG: N-acetylneuraminate synthase [Candidatus Omnitrophica bacterium]|nr:N-acetylneuraminate synthase [Candidatus Omnitrophota bacterium]
MNDHVYIIAEAGVNHNGDMTLAKEMIDVASDCGVDAVKFQSFNADCLVTPQAPKAEYQQADVNSTQYEMLKKLELSEDQTGLLADHCQTKQIDFISSPFDMESLRMLSSMPLRILKIPSGEITNLPYLRLAGRSRKRIILSTGMSTLDEVQTACDILFQAGTAKKDIIVLQCNSAYPSPDHDVNLRAMLSMKECLDLEVGLSDHTPGIDIALAAAGMGAKVIEKHFTLDRNFSGPDHKASIEPDELKFLVQGIRRVEKALGSSQKAPSPSEKKNISIVRKSIVALRDIKKGETYSDQNLTTKRPAFGLSPMRWDDVVGAVANRDYKKDEFIE